MNQNSNLNMQNSQDPRNMKVLYKTIENIPSKIELAREPLQQSKSPENLREINDQRQNAEQTLLKGAQSFRLATETTQKYKQTSPFTAYSENGAQPNHFKNLNSIESQPFRSAQQPDSQSQNYDFLFDPEQVYSTSHNQSSHISSGDGPKQSFSPNSKEQVVNKEKIQRQQYVDDSEEEQQQYYDEEADQEVYGQEEENDQIVEQFSISEH